jgi:hypothetical protein
MGKRFLPAFLASVWVVSLSGVAIGQHGGHMHGGPSSTSTSPQAGPSQQMPMKMRIAQAATIEGYQITFEVMDMSTHMSMPGMKGNPMHGADHSKSHAIMVKVEDTASKEIISDAKVSYTLIGPSGEKETGTLEWSGDHYGGTFGPKEKGTYQVQLMIESGGMEREAKFTHEFK